MMDTAHFHPMMVHFPIVLILIGFLAELAALLFKKATWLVTAGFTLMLLGTLAAIAGYLTGEFFTRELKGAAGELKEKHEVFAKATMFVMIAASCIKIAGVWLKKETPLLKWAVLVLFAAGAVLAGYTGFLGGNLVYNFMIGIN